MSVWGLERLTTVLAYDLRPPLQCHYGGITRRYNHARGIHMTQTPVPLLILTMPLLNIDCARASLQLLGLSKV